MTGCAALRRLSMALVAGALSAGAAQPRPATPPTVTIGVALTDTAQSRFVDGLTTADIRVRENGRLLTPTSLTRVRRPVSICVVFDASLRDDLEVKRRMGDAVIRTLAATLDPDDEIAAVVLRLAPDVRLPLTRAADVGAIAWGDVAPRGWGAGESVLAALDVLDRARHPRRVVLLLSDGFFSGREVSIPSLVTTRFRSEATVHGIEMVPGPPLDPGRAYMPVRDPRLVKPQLFDSPVRTREVDPSFDIVVQQGGGLRQPIGDAPDAEQAVRRLVNDLGAEYTLEYTPQQAPDGRYREVRVEPMRRDVRARHRLGYLASAADVTSTTTVVLPPVSGAPTAVAPREVAATSAVAPGGPPTPRGPSTTTDPRGPAADPKRAVYALAVDEFRRTGQVTAAQVHLGTWSRDELSAAASSARRPSATFAAAAALFHYEVAYAAAPLSVDNAWYHIELGEHLLEPLDIERDLTARHVVERWYAAAASLFVAQSDLSRAGIVIARGRRRVRASAPLLFVHGWIEELTAMRFDGDIARTDQLRPSLDRQRKVGLALAEPIFRQALAADAGYVAAALHLGRVLLLLGRPAEARPLLEPIADGRSGNAGERYLATLFLAEEDERRGDVDRARAALEGIAAFAPGRLTGWLALAQLEQRAGRFDRAREIVAAHITDDADDEWGDYRNGGIREEDVAWLRTLVAR